MRRSPIIASALVSVFALTGCFLLPDGEKSAPAATESGQSTADEEIEALLDRLNSTRGIKAAIGEGKSNVGDIYPYKATITAVAAARDDIKAVVADTWQTFLLPVFEDDRVMVEVNAGGLGTLELTKDFTDVPFIFQNALAGELDIWEQVHDVVGSPVRFKLHGYPPLDGGYSRFISVDDHVATIDVEALAAIPKVAGGAAQQWWAFGSFTSAEVLPNPDTVVLAGQVEATIGDAFNFTQYDSGVLPDGSPYLYVYSFLNDADIDDLGNSEEWPILRAVVDLLVAAPDPTLVRTLRVQPNVSSGDLASITIGACHLEPFADSHDSALFALLDGVALPEGSAPGDCPVR